MEKMPIALMIGRGSRLPAIINYATQPDSCVEIKMVVSFKKLEEDGIDVPGIALAKKHNLPTAYFNLPNWRAKTGKTRVEFDEALGWFLAQPQYQPQLIFMTGWGLLMSKEFLKFFPWDGGYYRIMNVHPALLPDNPQDDEITLSNGQKIPVNRGGYKENAIQTVLDQKVPVAGSTVHFVTERADAGPVVCRAEVKVEPNDTVDTLYPRIQAEEDKMGVSAIDLFARGKLEIKDDRVVILS